MDLLLALLDLLGREALSFFLQVQAIYPVILERYKLRINTKDFIFLSFSAVLVLPHAVLISSTVAMFLCFGFFLETEMTLLLLSRAYTSPRPFLSLTPPHWLGSTRSWEGTDDPT